MRNICTLISVIEQINEINKCIALIVILKSSAISTIKNKKNGLSGNDKWLKSHGKDMEINLSKSLETLIQSFV